MSDAFDLPDALAVTLTRDAVWTDEATGEWIDPETYTVTVTADIDGNTVGTNVSVAVDAPLAVIKNAYVEALRGMLNFSGTYREALSALGANAARRGSDAASLHLGRVTE